MTTRFDKAFNDVLEIIRQTRDNDLRDVGKVVVVRDLVGRIRLAVQRAPIAPIATALEKRLQDAAGPFFASGILIGDEMLMASLVFESPDAYELDGVTVVERLAVGAEWTRPPLPNDEPRPPRATLSGIKGGVGRSTAVCAWARHLANRGARVLVVDLDLESPGLSTTLLPPGASPDLGIVDWLVEDAVGNADEDIVRRMVANSPLASGTTGQVLIAPCMGSTHDSYLAKLARAYLDVPRPDGGVRTFAERLATMIDALESAVGPTVVLLDSRAGLHDLAAIATTRLSAMTFLFASGSRQTWEGYRILLRSWVSRPAIAREIRERLRIVAAQVPETGREQYLDRFVSDAYDLFADTLYEEVSPQKPNAFNFDVQATDAPHFPLPIYWSRPFQEWDPLDTQVTGDQISAAFGQFLERATDLVLDTESDNGPE